MYDVITELCGFYSVSTNADELIVISKRYVHLNGMLCCKNYVERNEILNCLLP